MLEIRGRWLLRTLFDSSSGPRAPRAQFHQHFLHLYFLQLHFLHLPCKKQCGQGSCYEKNSFVVERGRKIDGITLD